LLDLVERESALEDGQRAWLLRELQADLSDQVEDIRETGEAPSDLGAREMVVTRGIIRSLRNGEDPGPSGSQLLEKHQGLHWPWHGDSDDPLQRQRMRDFQGGRVSELMESRGHTIGGLADLSGVDVVELVAIVFGLTEMGLGN
jgi:hypothetical protein